MNKNPSQDAAKQQGIVLASISTNMEQRNYALNIRFREIKLESELWLVWSN